MDLKFIEIVKFINQLIFNNSFFLIINSFKNHNYIKMSIENRYTYFYKFIQTNIDY